MIKKAGRRSTKPHQEMVLVEHNFDKYIINAFSLLDITGKVDLDNPPAVTLQMGLSFEHPIQNILGVRLKIRHDLELDPPINSFFSFDSTTYFHIKDKDKYISYSSDEKRMQAPVELLIMLVEIAYHTTRASMLSVMATTRYNNPSAPTFDIAEFVRNRVHTPNGISGQ